MCLKCKMEMVLFLTSLICASGDIFSKNNDKTNRKNIYSETWYRHKMFNFLAKTILHFLNFYQKYKMAETARTTKTTFTLQIKPLIRGKKVGKKHLKNKIENFKKTI
uniref:Secreted protein n=1 Tax=Cacopsylla melanoneura TaxID=428564 RepID=A0A8D9FHP8_9HEMI